MHSSRNLFALSVRAPEKPCDLTTMSAPHVELHLATSLSFLQRKGRS